MMSVVEEDPAALKLSVLLLMLQHPEGFKFGEFSGAFQQLHGYHPQLSLHGYHSLKDLLAEMKDVVVLEGDSQDPVIKVASGLDLDQWLEENRWNDCEEETQSSLDDNDDDEGAGTGAEAEEATGKCIRGAEEATGVLDLLRSLLSPYEHGLRIEKIQEYLLARDTVDLAKLSITQGYKDTLEFLEQRMPELTIKYQKKRLKCVVGLTAGTAKKLQPPVSSSSCEKVLNTGLTLSLNCPPPPQDLSPALSQTAQNPEPRAEKNKTQNRTEPFLSTNDAILQLKELQLQELTATEEGDPAALKRNVLHLVLQHPKGVKFGDFSGAFQQLHGYAPKLTLHGYRSLRDLVADMKNVVVLEGNSQNPVIKAARGSHLYRWMEGGEKNGWGDSEGKAQSLSCEAAAGEDAEVLELLTSLLSTYMSGLRIEKVQEFLLAQNRVDLETFSTSQGYKDTLEFLEHQMPELTIQYRENRLKCVVQLTAGTAEKKQPPVSNSSSKEFQTNQPCTTLDSQDESPHRRSAGALELLTSLLSTYTSGLRIEKVQEFLLTQNRVDLEMFSVAQGYKDTLEFLEHRMPELTIQYRENRVKCVIRLTAGTAAKKQPPVSSSSCKKVLHNGATFSASCTSAHQGLPLNLPKTAQNPKPRTEKNKIQNGTKPPPSTNHAIMQIKVLLRSYKLGLRIEKVQEFLLAQNRVDLETFSISQGYKDTLEFLEHRMPGLTIQYRENRVKCVIRLTAGTAEKKQPPVSSSSCKKGLTEEGDHAALKRNVLHLVLLHPEGVKFGDFSGAFQQLHGYAPKLTLHGYSSLRDLVADMKDVVVLEGGSQNPVIKVASGSHFYQCLEEGEENRLDDSEGNSQSLSYKEAAGEDAEFSIAFVAVRNVLKCQPKGLKVKKLKGALREKYNLDLERLRSGLGYKDMVSFLQDMPGLLLRNSDAVRNCVVQLQSGPSSPAPSLDTDFSACNSNAAFEEPKRKESGTLSPSPSLDTDFCAFNSSAIPESQMSDLAAALVLVLDVLGGCPLGLNLKALKENLEAKHGFDLDAFSQGLGYEDVTSCLLDIPGLCLTYHSGKQPQDCTIQLLSDGPVLPARLLSASHSLDKPPSSSGSNTLHQKPMERKPDPCVSTSAEVSAPLSFDSKESSIRSETSSQRKVEKKPTPAEILALISSLLSSKGYEMGLRVKKVQELLLSKEEVDLEKFSIAQGHKDSLAFLECHMPELKIKYEENRLSCVLHLGSDSCISASTQVSAPDSEESSIKSELSTQRKVEKKPALEEVLAALSNLLSSKGYVLGLRLKKVQELLLTKEGINLEKFSIAQGYKDSLAFLECHMPELRISYQEDRLKCLIQLGPGSCFSTSTQANTPPSFDSKQSSIKSDTLNQRKMGKKPALEEVLALLSSLLNSKPYQSGLKLKKVQELLLTKEGLDLEKFSIAQGHKDSLAFLECHLPESCLIRYQDDPLSCVLQLGSDCGANSVPPLLDAPVPLMKTVRTAGPENPPSGFGSISKQLPTSRDSSANRAWIQSLSAPSTTITPVSQAPHGAILGRDKSPSQPQSGISAQLSSECQLRRTPPTEELPSLSNAQQLRRSNLTGPHHSKDLDELRQEVAHVLARHPEGMSLFQFRAEYSAAFQKHLPLGNASSAKQCLLQMPDVVCLKGYGVQTLLFPVSCFKESSLKTGQQILSRVEDAVVVPGHSVSKAVPVADPVLVFKPSLPTAPVRPQPHTIHSLTSGHLGEPCKAEISVLPQSEVLEAPKPRTLLQEHKMARAKLGNRPRPSYLTSTAEAAADCDYSLSEIYPVLVPKSSVPKITVAPVAFPHLYSECFKSLSNKETCPGPETSPQRPPKTASPEEEQVQTSARPRGTHLPPPSPVVSPSDWGEVSSGFPSKPTHPAKPWTSGASTPAPSPSQPLPASFMTWAQPLVFPPVMFLAPLPPSSTSVQNTSRIQPQKVAYQSSVPQALPQMRPVQPTSPLHSAEQRNYVYVAQGPGAFSQGQLSARTVMHAQSQAPVFAVDGLPVSLPPQNPSSSYAFRSQTIYQTECYHHPWLDGPQCRSTTSAVHNSIMTTPSARAPSQPAAYWNQSVDGNPFVNSPSTTSSFPPAPTHMPQQPSYASSCISTHSDALASSDLRASPHPLEPQTLSINNRDPQAFVYPQQYADVPSTISPVTTRPASSPTSVYLPTQTSGQPSYTSYNSTTDYGAPDHTRSLMATSKEAEKQDNRNVTWVEKQKPRLTQRPTEPYLSAFQNSPPPKSPGKCIIL